MELAAAMKYGGELVAAKDCTYDSFKELVPLCPECKEPVYLRVGGDRTSTKGKEYQIGPHWCHFKGTSAEQVAACENRVNGYTEGDRQRIATQARGQRLKLLQRWFWNVFFENFTECYGIPRSRITEHLPVLEKSFSIGEECSVCYYVPCSSEWENKSPFPVSLGNYSKEWIESSKEHNHGAPLDSRLEIPCTPDMINAIQVYGKEEFDSAQEHYQRYFEQGLFLPVGIDKFLHERITIEIHFFLMAKGNRPLLISVVSLALVMMGCNQLIGGWFSKQMCDDYFPPDVAVSALALSIVSIPWASEFQRLGAKPPATAPQAAPAHP